MITMKKVILSIIATGTRKEVYSMIINHVILIWTNDDQARGLVPGMERGSVPTARCRARTLRSTIWMMMNVMVILPMMVMMTVKKMMATTCPGGTKRWPSLSWRPTSGAWRWQPCRNTRSGWLYVNVKEDAVVIVIIIMIMVMLKAATVPEYSLCFENNFEMRLCSATYSWIWQNDDDTNDTL